MAGKHILEGLMKWSTREHWRDRFEQALEDHLQPACDETGVEVDDIVSAVGEGRFMSTVWACAFEDFLTREFDDGKNAVDDYLKRRGWKETKSVRTYMAALRNSTMSLYEVSDIVRGTSFRARDLIRGGEPVLISEHSATRSLNPWDRIAARVVEVGSRMQICGGVLPFEDETAKALIEMLHRLDTLGGEGEQSLADAIGPDFDAAAITALSPTERLRATAPLFTAYWLIDLIDRAKGPPPELRNAEGDELVICEVRYPLAAGVTADDIRAVMVARPEFRPASSTSWNWVSLETSNRASVKADPSQGSLTFETRLDDGALVLGNVELEDNALVFSTNSRRRSTVGRELLATILGRRGGSPSVRTESFEQIVASRKAAMAPQLDIPEEESCAIIHDHLDRHYRGVLDQPVPMLEGQSPRAAVRTDGGRNKVADWLKMMENRTARYAGPGSALATYNFGWLWTELGVSELRR